MFVCEKCIKPDDYHSILPVSRGPCEVCHVVSNCYEVYIHRKEPNEKYLSESAITRQGCHDWIAILKEELTLNHSARWMSEWIDTLSYLCSCTQCRRNMRENRDAYLDTEMLDKIFHI
jgi:hypothetical protein